MPLRARWDETTAMLGSTLANVLDVFNPELVVLGGGVTRQATSCWSRSARRPFARRWHRPGSADIVLAGLGEELGVVSAATVAFERLPLDIRLPEAAEPRA